MPIKESVLPIIRQYFDEDPLKAAQKLESIPIEHAAELLSSLNTGTLSRIFPKLQPAFAAEVFILMHQEKMRDVFQRLDPQFGSSLFLSLPQENRKRFISTLPKKLKQDMQEILTYPEDSVGRLMSPDFVGLRGSLKVKQAIQKIRALVKKDTPSFYVYVIDDDQILMGVLNMRDLMLASSEKRLDQIMQKNVVAFSPFTQRDEASEEMAKRKYFAVPVVDGQQHLLGVVRAVRLMKGEQEMKEEAAEDMQKMFGVGGDEKTFSPFLFSLKKRLPWLHINLITAFMAAAVVGFFEDIIAKITILAVFLPVVAGQGGNAGAQSLAVVMRGLVMREIPKQKIGNLIVKETVIGAFNGLIIGLVTAGVAWLWNGNPYLGVVIGLGMLVNLAVAGFAGAAIPLIMKTLRMDPAQSSSIILTTVTDVVGFFAFLGFAVVFQAYLL